MIGKTAQEIMKECLNYRYEDTERNNEECEITYWDRAKGNIEVRYTSGELKVFNDILGPTRLKAIGKLEQKTDITQSQPKLNELEEKHGFPCGICGAKDFEEAGDKCRGLNYCPGESMSKEVFEQSPPKCTNPSDDELMVVPSDPAYWPEGPTVPYREAQKIEKKPYSRQ